MSLEMLWNVTEADGSFLHLPTLVAKFRNDLGAEASEEGLRQLAQELQDKWNLNAHGMLNLQDVCWVFWVLASAWAMRKYLAQTKPDYGDFGQALAELSTDLASAGGNSRKVAQAHHIVHQMCKQHGGDLPPILTLQALDKLCALFFEGKYSATPRGFRIETE